VESAHDVQSLIKELPEERCRVEMVFDASGKPQAAHKSGFDTVGVKR
jgi:hypothetical protein